MLKIKAMLADGTWRDLPDDAQNFDQALRAQTYFDQMIVYGCFLLQTPEKFVGVKFSFDTDGESADCIVNLVKDRPFRVEVFINFHPLMP